MDDESSIADLPMRPGGLILAEDAQAVGRGHRLRALHRSGVVTRVWPGVYGVRDERGRAGPAVDEARYRQRVRAAAARMPDRVFTSYSAAVLLGLPIVGPWPRDVFVLADGAHGSRRAGVRYVGHRLEIPQTTLDGVRVTATAHTVIQLARRASLVCGLVAADGALRRPPYAERAASLVPEQLWAEHQRLGPYPGRLKVLAVLQRATPLADGPLESISRLVIEELGFAAPELQHRFWLPGLGEHVWVDFYWPEVGVAMEADGHGKYLDGGSAGAAAQRVVHEKRREDAIREQVRRFGRWGWSDAWAVSPLERRLERAGIPRPGPRRRLFVP